MGKDLKRKNNKKKNINRFVLIIFTLLLLFCSTILYSNLNKAKPSGFLAEAAELSKNGDLEKYRDFLSEQVKRIKNKALQKMVYRRLGLMNLTLGNYQQARETYEKLYLLNPDNPENCINLGLSFLYLRKYDQAIEYFKKAEKLDPDLPEIYTNLGIAFINKQKLPESLNSFKQAIKIDPKFCRAYTNLTSIYVHLGEYKKAKGYIKKAIKNKACDSPEFEELIQEQLKQIDKLLEQSP